MFVFWVIALDKCTAYTSSHRQSVRRTPEGQPWKLRAASSGRTGRRGPPPGGHDYPLTFSVDYPDRKLNRLSTAFRIVWIIPIAILAARSRAAASAPSAGEPGRPVRRWRRRDPRHPRIADALFRKKYPRWWYDWNLQLTRFSNRIAVYFALMDDHYPSTDEQQAVHLDFPYPDAEHDLSRGLPLVKWLLAIPHYIALIFLTIGAHTRRHLRVVCDPLHRPLPTPAV